MTSRVTLGALVGALLAGGLADRLGRQAWAEHDEQRQQPHKPAYATD